SRRVALIAAVSFAVFSAAPSIEGFTANAEIFAQLPIVLSALFAWREKWVWAGAMAAGAVLLKPSGLSALLLAVGWVFVTGASLRGVIRVGAAFGLVLIPSVLHGAWIGWEHYWESMYTRRAAYADANSIGLRTQLGRFLLGVLDTAPSWAVPATLSGIAVTAKLDRARGFLLLWLGTSVVGMAMGSFWFRHYFIQAIPPLAILGAMGLSALATRRRRWIWVVPIAASIAVFSWDVFLWSRPAAETSLRVYGRPAYLVADEAADYVAANTVPSDRIFVAFSQAEIYYLSRRKASFPHMYYADFVYSERLFQEALASIREGEPAMVLVVQPPPVERMSMDDFIGILDEGYELVRTVQTPVPDARPILIYRRRALDGRS
ncbi:MAG TPA: hypothetical protein VK858_12825, partial [Longimicrobiales bacterium]|nr:hypothetical protein [Longimicrobiales bacterium]